MSQYDGMANFSSNLFAGNTAFRGGAIYLKSLWMNSQVLMAGNTFLVNSAAQGGAIYMSVYYPRNVIVNNTFVNNTVTCHGDSLCWGP
jgi:predicted outer membrane repeat protein